MIATVGQISIGEGTFSVRWGDHLPAFYPGAKAIASVEIVNSDGTRAACGLSVEECRTLGDVLHQAASDATFRRSATKAS